MSERARTETWLVWDSDQVVTGIHAAQNCSGPCVIHKPTDHWMRSIPLSYDTERRSFVRSCLHGVVHQDPDERTRLTNIVAKTKASKVRRTRAQEQLEQWSCPECLCGCCSLIRV